MVSLLNYIPMYETLKCGKIHVLGTYRILEPQMAKYSGFCFVLFCYSGKFSSNVMSHLYARRLKIVANTMHTSIAILAGHLVNVLY